MNPARLKAQLGSHLAEKLISRLADFQAAAAMSDLLALPGSPRELAGTRSGQMSIDLVDGNQLVFIPPLEHQAAAAASSSVNWSNVRRIKILGLERGNE